MEQKSYRAFGHILVRTKLAAGEVMSDVWMRNGVIPIEKVDDEGNIFIAKNAFFWFVAKGQHLYTNLDTGERKTLNPGWCSLTDPLSAGRQQLTVPVDSESVCFTVPPGEALPVLQVVNLKAGESKTFPVGTRLYVVEGELDIAGTAVGSMRQVWFTSGEKEARAGRDSLLIIFGA